MKKVGIITFHDSINYGAILQAFALQKFLKMNNYNVEIINYKNPKRGLKDLTIKRKILNYIWNKILKRLIVGEKRNIKTKKFINNYINVGTKLYKNEKQIKDDPPIYDYYITGSDQVWNPKNNNNEDTYFLGFVSKNKVKISYAASFGVSELKDKYFKDYKRRINNIDFLSVREETGKNIIENLTNRKASVVLDPTLLINSNIWKNYSNFKKINKNYVLCYHMPGFKNVNKKIDEIAYKIAEGKGWEVIHIGEKEYKKLIPRKIRIFDAGPSEFIGLFENASFVVTNSFHGTAFSIIFNKSFYIPYDEKLPKEKRLISRIEDLLERLEIKERLVSLEREIEINDSLYLNYSNVNKILEKERKKSKDFLKEALGGKIRV